MAAYYGDPTNVTAASAPELDTHTEISSLLCINHHWLTAWHSLMVPFHVSSENTMTSSRHRGMALYDVDASRLVVHTTDHPCTKVTDRCAPLWLTLTLTAS